MVKLIKDGVVKIKADTDKIGINRLISEGYELATNSLFTPSQTDAQAEDASTLTLEGVEGDSDLGGAEPMVAEDKAKGEKSPQPKPHATKKHGKKRR